MYFKKAALHSLVFPWFSLIYHMHDKGRPLFVIGTSSHLNEPRRWSWQRCRVIVGGGCVCTSTVTGSMLHGYCGHEDHTLIIAQLFSIPVQSDWLLIWCRVTSHTLPVLWARLPNLQLYCDVLVATFVLHTNFPPVIKAIRYLPTLQNSNCITTYWVVESTLFPYTLSDQHVQW